MKPKIKDTLDEMIGFDQNEKLTKELKNACNDLGREMLLLLIRKILTWQKLSYFGIEQNDQYPITKYLYDKYTIFFSDYQNVGSIFNLHESHIGFAINISDEEQKEIREYINANYKVTMRFRVYDDK
jgi:hypothetical protein